MLPIQTCLMAAGEGTRMHSKKSKVLHEICGRTLLDWVMAAAPESGERPIVIVGRNESAVRETYGERVRYAVQYERLGTGHAVMMAADEIKKSGADAVLIVAGDMPLFRRETLEKLCEGVVSGRCEAAVLTAILDDPTGYGRILRDEAGHVVGVVEQKDASPEQLLIHETNVSGYCVRRDLLLDALSRLTNDNAQKEYYITDIVGILVSDGRTVEACVAEDPSECLGINDRVQLAAAERQMRRRINEKIMKSGVTLIDPENTYIEADVVIGCDSVIYPNNVIARGTRIGENCVIRSGCRIDSSVIGDFVEIKNSFVGDGTKVSHLTYIGDADVGRRVNVGCGTVFVNYDGKRKYRTSVGDDVFIGCNTNLVSPVTVGDGAFIAAGSTVTDEVPADALAIARARQVNKDGWAEKRRQEP